jgi:hypothetical protein
MGGSIRRRYIVLLMFPDTDSALEEEDHAHSDGRTISGVDPVFRPLTSGSGLSRGRNRRSRQGGQGRCKVSEGRRLRGHFSPAQRVAGGGRDARRARRRGRRLVALIVRSARSGWRCSRAVAILRICYETSDILTRSFALRGALPHCRGKEGAWRHCGRLAPSFRRHPIRQGWAAG